MIARTTQWSLNNRLLVLVAAVLLLLWGGYETARMPVDIFPDLPPHRDRHRRGPLPSLSRPL
jgi:Cu/Ag efflux pump CusA